MKEGEYCLGLPTRITRKVKAEEPLVASRNSLDALELARMNAVKCDNDLEQLT